ncbi:MAG: glycosyltransferase [Alphaproteobacteria bacterium]|nr:glycosyltransferase [Alphaproteobacteria bacterium]
MKPLSIAFFGSSLVSAYWNGAATYYRGILQALAVNGHRITFYEPDAYDRQQHRDIDDPPWAEVIVYPAAGEAGVERALDRARAADLIVKASGVGVFDALLEARVPAIKRPGAIAAFWDVDAPATLDRIAGSPHDPFRALIPAYDIVLTYGGGPPVVEAYQRFGARRCVPIYNGLDPLSHYPVAPKPRFACDLGLVANRLPDRERRIDEFFIAVAADLPDRRFLLGGSGWSDKPLPANIGYLGHVYTRDHNAFNASALAVLNVSRDSMAAYGFSPATRVFEAAGAGACIITDMWEGIELFFEPGREILIAENGPAVAEQLARLGRMEACRIGAAVRARALADHTYAQRVVLLQRVLEGIE